MRTTEIFNGHTFIKVSEGSKFQMNGVWSWDVGTQVIFNARQGINVVAKVISTNGFGTELEVIDIETLDDISNTTVEATDVEEVEVVAYDEPVKLKLKKNKFTKKEMIAFVEEHHLDIDTTVSKADLVQILKAKDLIEYI